MSEIKAILPDAMSTPFRTAVTVGMNLENRENQLMEAYGMDDSKSADAIKARIALGAKLGISPLNIDTFDNNGTKTGTKQDVPLRSLQLIAEQKFQHGSQVLNMFSGLLDKIDQLKQRLISKFSN